MNPLSHTYQARLIGGPSGYATASMRGAPAGAELPHHPTIGVAQPLESLGLGGGTRIASEEHVMQVRDLMSRQVVTIGTSESCLDAVVRMQRARARHLP